MATSAHKLTPLVSIERISDLVIRVLGCNSSHMTLQGTNSYLVGKGEKKILIDTSNPNKPEYITTLKKALTDFNSSIKEIVVTHWHGDHVGSVADVQTNLLSEPVPVSKFKRLSKPDADISPARYSFIENQHVFKTEGATLRAIHTPGHTEEHMILYLEEENAIFAGDTILGESTAVFEDLHSYMESLQTILDLKPSVIYPGHGIVIKNPVELVSYYIKHRNDREKQIIDALLKDVNKPLTTLEIVYIVYEGLAPVLVQSAAGSATHHLNKLVKDKLVVCLEEDEVRWRYCGPTKANI